MARRLFLHIGMMKSGTTYIQRVCNRSADALEAAGIRWALGAYGRQASAYSEFTGSKRLMPSMEGSWDALREEVATCPHDVLVSFELIGDLTEKRLREFLDGLATPETHVIVTARDFSRVLPSLWQESTQNRGTERWPDFLKVAREDGGDSRLRRNIDNHTDYASVLRKWSSAVPVERLHLVTVPPSSAGPDELWHRFASVIGAPMDLGKTKKANETIGAVSSELMVRLNDRVQDLSWPSYRLGFKHGLAKQGLADRAGGEPRVGYPTDALDWVHERGHAMIEQVRELGPNVVGDLDDLIPNPAVGGVEAEWAPSDAELLEAALDGLESLGRQLAEIRLEAWKRDHGQDRPLPERAGTALRGARRKIMRRIR